MKKVYHILYGSASIMLFGYSRNEARLYMVKLHGCKAVAFWCVGKLRDKYIC